MNNGFEKRIKKLENHIVKKGDLNRLLVVLFGDKDIIINKTRVMIPKESTMEEVLYQYLFENRIPVPAKIYYIPYFRGCEYNLSNK